MPLRISNPRNQVCADIDADYSAVDRALEFAQRCLMITGVALTFTAIAILLRK